jgi:hypothetical protein
MFKLLLLISVIFVLSSCASSNPVPETEKVDANAQVVKVDANSEVTAAGDNPEVAETDTEKEEIICTTVPTTGSHLKTRKCRTKSQAEDEQKRARAYIERLRTQPITEGNKG